jgi:phospholipid/cholesterol/gamma-HCH transport system substrate-binding protein
MATHTKMRNRLLILLVGLVFTVSGCGFSGLYGAPLPGGADLGDHPYTVTIYFSNVLDLVPQSTVKVNDVEVGRVESVELSKAGDDSGDKSLNGWTAKVKIQVNGNVQLPSNARAEVRITSLLGEKYVALEQPLDKPADTKLKDGSQILITHTGSAPEVEDVLGALSLLLNGGGLQQIRVITTELNKALAGNENAVRDLLGQLNTFVGTLNDQKDKIFTALDSVDRLTKTLNANKRIIEETLDTMPQALEILKNERTKFVTLLTSLSDLGSVATHVITATQQNLTAALKSLAPSLEQLTAAGSDLPQSLKIGLTFPFPIGTTLNAVKGDYANLHAYVDLSLSDEICAISADLCKVVSKLPLSQAARPLTSEASTAIAPRLIGAGG